MRRLFVLASTALGIYLAARWWRQHRRTGTNFVNRYINPWLDRHGFIAASRGELALIEHVGRKSGTVRRTPVHPVRTAEGFRIIVPVGGESQWARNVLAAGHCSMTIAERRYELDEPILETPADVPDLPRPARALFAWLGFRYLRLHIFAEVPGPAAAPRAEQPTPGLVRA